MPSPYYTRAVALAQAKGYQVVEVRRGNRYRATTTFLRAPHGHTYLVIANAPSYELQWAHGFYFGSSAWPYGDPTYSPRGWEHLREYLGAVPGLPRHGPE
jgi:hypothetical protein